MSKRVKDVGVEDQIKAAIAGVIREHIDAPLNLDTAERMEGALHEKLRKIDQSIRVINVHLTLDCPGVRGFEVEVAKVYTVEAQDDDIRVHMQRM